MPGQVGVPNGQPTPVNGQRVVTCEYSAYNRGYVTGTIKLPITIEPGTNQEISLNHKYFFIDIGRFGTTKMLFTQGKRGLADTITLSNEGLNRELSFSQSGFAGQTVRLEAQDDRGRTKLTLSCTGESGFKKNIVNSKYKQLVCVGRANLIQARGEKQLINVSLPYDAGLLNSDIQLASGLTAQVIGDGEGLDNARIEYTANGVGLDHSVNSGAY